MIGQKTERALGCLLACGVIVAALVGLLYSFGGNRFVVDNVYGQQVELYGDGIYAYNSVVTVSSRFGADVNGLLGAMLLMILCVYKKLPLWADILKAAQVIGFTYYSACLVFGISMNALFFLYVICFGLSAILSVDMLVKHFKKLRIVEVEKEKKSYGISTFLIAAGIIVSIIWISLILPYMRNNNYGGLLGVLTAEVTYAIDLGIICPLLVLCGMCIVQKKELGYKLAPILLYILFSVAPMVVLQNIFCIRLGIDVPIQAFIGMILSFVIIGSIAIVFFIKSIRKLTCIEL